MQLIDDPLIDGQDLINGRVSDGMDDNLHMMFGSFPYHLIKFFIRLHFHSEMTGPVAVLFLQAGTLGTYGAVAENFDGPDRVMPVIKVNLRTLKEIFMKPGICIFSQCIPQRTGKPEEILPAFIHFF